MARQKSEPTQTAEAEELRKQQTPDPATERKGLKPGYVRLNLVVRQDTDVRLYRVAKDRKKTKSAMGEELLISAIAKLAIDKKHRVADDEIPSEDREVA